MADAGTRLALIPGGAKGIGREIARRLGEQGWSVVVSYRKSTAEAEETAALVERSGGRALAVRADVSTPEACAALVAEARRWANGAGIDALIQCAGPYHRVDLLQETPEGWREMFAANLDGLFYMSRLCAPLMIERRWGRIIAFSMANADKLQAQPGLTAHYLAKVGVLGLVRSLAKSLAKHGITVNAISPGFIDSGGSDPAELQSMLKNIPAGYIGSTADAASAAMYLLSPEASYVTGTSLHVSGGWGI